MAMPAPTVSLSPDEYLDLERSAEVRHEYLAGQLFAMAGASEAHNTIALNLAAELRTRLRGGPCRVFIADMKVRIDAAETFYYPDVFVTCDPDDAEPYFKRRPSVIFEVLSPATEATDRREKFLVYRQLESLEEYVLVRQDRMEVEIYRRQDGGESWQLEVLGQGDVLRLGSLGEEVALEEIYGELVERPQLPRD